MADLERLHTTWLSVERIQSLQQLVQLAQTKVDLQRPIQHIYLCLDKLLMKADQRLIAEDLRLAFVLFLRYLVVVISHLPTHPEYRLSGYAEQKTVANRQCDIVLTILEQLKPRLKRWYETYQEPLRGGQRMFGHDITGATPVSSQTVQPDTDVAVDNQQETCAASANIHHNVVASPLLHEHYHLPIGLAADSQEDPPPYSVEDPLCRRNTCADGGLVHMDTSAASTGSYGQKYIF
ncbi:hypothetical protein DL89DRAFT_318745 [Linderina pennispora]|uniref:USP8 dimerisation domain-containing protein n=1 Tax=Linderina pennispora TaxID=61395 RepID=A0A1Y1W5J9_9FUNG|nr:uncharacterized protein DL89DRAFT_318745 [Linderina pennispora]ORX68821.1 hypothetical protein DL89DRAFT_318745 [Linderina pennispora]